jgi:hypothetical protein
MLSLLWPTIQQAHTELPEDGALKRWNIQEWTNVLIHWYFDAFVGSLFITVEDQLTFQEGLSTMDLVTDTKRLTIPEMSYPPLTRRAAQIVYRTDSISY